MTGLGRWNTKLEEMGLGEGSCVLSDWTMLKYMTRRL